MTTEQKQQFRGWLSDRPIIKNYPNIIDNIINHVEHYFCPSQPAASSIQWGEVEAKIDEWMYKADVVNIKKAALFGYSLAQSTIDSLTRLLEDLTPSGSEFVNDPQRCVEFIRDQQASIAKVIKPLKSEIASLKEALEAMCNAAEHHSWQFSSVNENREYRSYCNAKKLLNSIDKSKNTEDGKDKE